MPHCACEQAPPCVLEKGTWYCSSCWSKLIPDGWNCGDKLDENVVASFGCVPHFLGRNWLHHNSLPGEVLVNGHQQHFRRRSRSGVPAQARASLHGLRRTRRGTRKPVPSALRKVQVATRNLQPCKDSK